MISAALLYRRPLKASLPRRWRSSNP